MKDSFRRALKSKRSLGLSCAGLLVSTLVGCGQTDTVASSRVRDPQVVMTSALTGWATWPSGARWIVLTTSDGWRTVENRTPIAVPTDGGLVLAARDNAVAVGILAHQQLTVSPVMRFNPTRHAWTPSQLTAGLLSSSTSLARSQGASWAVLDVDGAVVVSADDTTEWRQATSSRELDTSGHLDVTGVGFPDGATGFVTGSGPSNLPVLFVTTDEGRSWRPESIRIASDGTATALTPCRVGSAWLAPVLAGGQLRVFASSGANGPWTSGTPLAVQSDPVVACGPTGVWAAVSTGSTDELVVASPGGTWVRQGDLGGHIASLSVVSGDHAIATRENPAALTSIDLGAAFNVTPLPLPDWVDSLGGPSMRN